MKKIGIRILALFLLCVLLISSTSALHISATDAPPIYSVEYNSGSRNVICTTLDGTSAAPYYKNYDYDDLSEMSASTLFSSLQTLMRNTHTYISSYDDCHYKADKTDCTNGSGNVSLIYTSYSATMAQWNGWNREHVWPKSLGGDTTKGGGADLHHIRPSDAGVNSSRGNKKYGEVENGNSSTGSNPAKGYLGGTYNATYFEPADEVKGDIARICLYVYVRWNSQWGANDITKVFQSVDVLLAWCELDPVDTWEMGRNEVVGHIQGNRNVFIDYPEYAWLIFDREVPSDMITPSGEAKNADESQGGIVTPPIESDQEIETAVPTESETSAPTESETTAPTESETTVSTESETSAPTESETSAPTESETTAPTESETSAPTESETTVPTESETTAPIESETSAPTESETSAPTESETSAPTESETVAPAESEQESETVAPAESEQESETAPPTESEEGSETAAPTEDEQESETASSTEGGDCDHSFGDWEAIGSTGGRSRTCSKCGMIEFSSQAETDANEVGGCESMICTAGIFSVFVPMLGLVFLRKKKRK